MNQTAVCPRCQSPLSPDSAQGLCPKCLLGAALTPPTSSTRFQAPSLDLIADLFPEYDELREIGQGGMGVVYRARHTKLGRPVAIKVLPPPMGEDPTFEARFTREAKTLANLRHPNIVTIFDFGERGKHYYLVMEFVEGSHLRGILQKQSQPEALVIELADQICEALAYAHEQGIVHRDIKPENILIDERGHVRIADFGLARLIHPSANEFTITATDQAVGTPIYMAPEQLESPQALDQRADIYSLGVVLYEMLTGKLPLGSFPPPSKVAPIPPRFDDVVMRCLSSAPEDRYTSVSELRQALRTISLPKRVPRSDRRPKSSTVEQTEEAFPYKVLISGSLIFLLSFLPWIEVESSYQLRHTGNAWSSQVLFMGVSLPNSLVVIVGVILAGLAIAKLRKVEVPVGVFRLGAIFALAQTGLATLISTGAPKLTPGIGLLLAFATSAYLFWQCYGENLERVRSSVLGTGPASRRRRRMRRRSAARTSIGRQPRQQQPRRAKG